MKISTTTINQHFKKPLSTKDIVSALEKTEVEIDDITSVVKFDKKIVTAKIKKIEKHPNAERLNLTTIEWGKNKSVKVVCGANNLELGLVVAYAQVGSVLPDGNKIEKIKIRGVESRGMLCSEKELGISSEHSGIYVLDPDLPLGISLCDIEFFGDILDIKTPTNRWDMLSSLGLAREIFANSLSCDLVELPAKSIEFEKAVKKVVVKNQKACKRFISADLTLPKHFKKIKSPKWLVDNLKTADIRPINPIVDITNYVMLETGQPSHAYDKLKLKGSLQVRNAKAKEKVTTLDDKQHMLTKNDLVIVDGGGVVGIAGVMGAKSCEVDENTTQILLEVANFDKTVVRKSAMNHRIRTEASARFEKGLPLPLCEFALKRLLYLFEEICEAKVTDKVAYDQLFAWPWIQHVGLRIRKAEKFLGIKIDEKQILTGLKKRGFEVEHFSVVKEAKKHLGKPYKWGANFKQDGTDAFDCSYLIDYVFSLIGVYVGHTALAQFHHGESVELGDIKPGDIVFYEGLIEKSATSHYYLLDKDGNHRKKTLQNHKKVGHNGIYVGKDKVIMAAEYQYKDGKWLKRKTKGVVEVNLSEFSKNPGYLGARRYVDNFNHTLAVTAPWWRNDIKIEQDMYEECAKIVGYDNMPSTLPQLPPAGNSKNQMILKLQALKNTLVGSGLFEIMTYSFVSLKHLSLGGEDETLHLKIINPLSSEQAYLRSNLFVSQLNVAAKNSSYYESQYGFFELSRIYEKTKSRLGKIEHWQLAISTVGDNSIETIKSFLQILSQKYHWQVELKKADRNGFVSQRFAEIYCEGKSIGLIGQVSPSKLHEVKLNRQMSYLQITISEQQITQPIPIVGETHNYQFIERDITLELNCNVWWQDLNELLVNQKNVVKVIFLDEFINDELNKKSKKRLSFRLVLDCGAQPSAEQIDDMQKLIMKKLQASMVVGKVKII